MNDNKYFQAEFLCEDSTSNLNRVVRLADNTLFTMGGIQKSPHKLNGIEKTQYVFGRRSTDGGKNFDEITFCYQLPDRLTHMALADILIDRDGYLHCFFLRIRKYDVARLGDAKGSYKECFQGDIVHLRFDSYKGENPIYQKIECLDRYSGSMNNFIQLRSGRLIAPFSTIVDNEKSVFVSSTCYSDDCGLTWKVSNDIEVESDETHGESGAVEPVVIETSKDNQLILILRTVLGSFYYSISTDGGETWSMAKDSGIPSSNAPATMERLPDGRILILWNDCLGMPMHGTRYSMARQALMAAVSDDDLKTLKGVRTIMRKEQGDPDNVLNCYPFAEILENGDAIVRPFVVQSRFGEGWDETTAKVLYMKTDWLDEKEFSWTFANGFGPWVVDPAGSEVLEDGEHTKIRLKKDETTNRPGFAEINFPYGRKGKLTLQCCGEKQKVRFLVHQVYLDISGFMKSEMTDRYGKYIADEYAEAILPVTDAESELIVEWEDGKVRFSINEKAVEVMLPSHIKGINHLSVLAEEGAVTIGDFACETQGDMPTGIELNYMDLFM